MMKKYGTGLLTVLLGLCLTGHAALVAHYTFDTEAGITNDVSGNGHNLSVYSGAPGYTTNGVISDGSTVMNSGDTASDGWKTDNYILTPSFTFAAWVKPMGSVSMVMQPISLSTGYEIYAYNGYRFATMSSEGMSYTLSSTSPSIGTWQHIAMTFNAISGPDGNGTYTGTITTYIDGALDTTLADAKYAPSDSNILLLGHRSSSFFNGLMDDVRIYDTALSGLEIQNMALEGLNPVIAHYTFDTAETITNDVSGNGNNLSVTYNTPGYTADGKHGGATVFNSGDTASDGWITPAGVLTPSFTFAAWLKPMGSVSMVMQPISLSTGYEIYAGGGYRYATMSSEPMSYTLSSTSPEVGTWQHIAMAFTATDGPDANGTYTGTFTTYINGELDTTKTNAKYAVDGGNYQMLGCRSTKFFNGLMDDVYLCRRALTQSEVQDLMGLPTPPVGGYPEWAQGWGVDIGAATNDYDGDGLINLYEYGLGGDPTNSADVGTSPQYGIVEQGGTSYFGYVYPQLTNTDSGLTYSLETSTNLVSGTWTNAGYTVLGTNMAGGMNMVSNYTDTVDSQKFIRLMISTNTPAN